MKLWITRNKDNNLIVFQSKPILNEWQEWDEVLNEDFMFIPEYLFPEITFENSPQEIELRLEKENIVKILKTYDNIFGLSDGGIARSDEDIEYAADVILKSLKESNS